MTDRVLLKINSTLRSAHASAAIMRTRRRGLPISVCFALYSHIRRNAWSRKVATGFRTRSCQNKKWTNA